jgi:hypothetical protein
MSTDDPAEVHDGPEAPPIGSPQPWLNDYGYCPKPAADNVSGREHQHEQEFASGHGHDQAERGHDHAVDRDLLSRLKRVFGHGPRS